MKHILQTFWLTVRCICSENVARDVLFADDHHARQPRMKVAVARSHQTWSHG